MADRFDKFTERARRVLTYAQEEAQRLNHHYIGTEHMLLALAREQGSAAGAVLANLGVDVNRVRTAVTLIIGRGDRPTMGEIGLTPRAKRVIELTIDEARRLNHQHIGTEHILLGLVREGSGIGAGVLESLGVNLERVRAETIRVLSEDRPQGHGGAPNFPLAEPAPPHTYSTAPLDDSDLAEARARHRETPIEDLNLSIRAYNCLKRSELNTVGQIMATSESELIALRNFGRHSFEELIEKLIELGVLRRR